MSDFIRLYLKPLFFGTLAGLALSVPIFATAYLLRWIVSA